MRLSSAEQQFLSGLGFDPFSFAASLVSGGMKSGGGGGGMFPGGDSTSVTVSPTFQTQISPQISPVMQNVQGASGPVIGGTTQTLPTSMTAPGTMGTQMPLSAGTPIPAIPGAIPGADDGLLPGADSGFPALPPGVSSAAFASRPQSGLSRWALPLGVAGIAIVFLLARKKRGA